MRVLLVAALAAAVHVPSGYRVVTWATGLEHPTALSFGPDHRLYVSEDVGRVVSVTRGSSRPRPFASGLTVPLGLLWRARTLYVSEQGRVETLSLSGRRRTILSKLPFGLHQQDAIVSGPGDIRIVPGAHGMRTLVDVLGDGPRRLVAELAELEAGADFLLVDGGSGLNPGIATLAAEGLSNREIGQRLFLSPRTISSHLYRIFPKLDITSRRQLMSRLEELQAPPP